MDKVFDGKVDVKEFLGMEKKVVVEDIEVDKGCDVDRLVIFG